MEILIMTRILFVLMLLPALLFWSNTAYAGEIVVDPEGTASGDGSSEYPYGTIHSAVVNADQEGGDVIYVNPGAYRENIVIRKPLTMRSGGPGVASIGLLPQDDGGCAPIQDTGTLDIETAARYAARIGFLKLLKDQVSPVVPKVRNIEIRLDDLHVIEADDGNSEHPYLIVLGFRTKPLAPGSTQVQIATLDPQDWGEGMGPEATRNIPDAVGRMVFYDLCNTLSDFELFGIVVVALEHDSTPWSKVSGLINDLATGLHDGLENTVANPDQSLSHLHEGFVEALSQHFTASTVERIVNGVFDSIASGESSNHIDWAELAGNAEVGELAKKTILTAFQRQLEEDITDSVTPNILGKIALALWSGLDPDEIEGYDAKMYLSLDDVDSGGLAIRTGPLEPMILDNKQHDASAGSLTSVHGLSSYRVTGELVEVSNVDACPVGESVGPTNANDWTSSAWVDRGVFHTLERTTLVQKRPGVIDEILGYLRKRMAVAVFFENNDYGGRYWIVPSHNAFGSLQDVTEVGATNEVMDDEIDSLMYFVPEGPPIILEVFEDAEEDGRYDESHVRICGPASIRNLNDAFGKYDVGMGGDEISSFRFVRP
jgi:hypothetical protein